jgi:hypothetical protein
MCVWMGRMAQMRLETRVEAMAQTGGVNDDTIESGRHK